MEKKKFKTSYYTYIGLGLSVAYFYGISKVETDDPRGIGILILAICFLLIDVIKYLKT